MPFTDNSASFSGKVATYGITPRLPRAWSTGLAEDE